MQRITPLTCLLTTALVGLCAGAAHAQPAPAGEPRAAASPKAASPKAPSPKAASPQAAKAKLAPPRVQISHAPVSVAAEETPLDVEAAVDRPERLRHALLLYRRAGAKRYREVPFRRAAPGPYRAVIPAKAMVGPAIEYVIELVHHDGRRSRGFASRRNPHVVQVQRDGMDIIGDRLAERIDNRRSIFTARGEYVSFGTSMATVTDADGNTSQREVHDQFYRVELSYAYRTLGVVAAFGIRGGVVRGTAPTPDRPLLAEQTEDERFDVGLNYGAPWVRFRAHDYFHIDGSVLANVTEVGFSMGTGSTVHIGDMYGSRLSLGFEWIQDFGARFFTQLHIQAHERVRISPLVELTNMPSAARYGVRLIGEVGVNIGAGFAATAQGGYQARESTSGGPSAGGTLSYAF